MSPKVRFPQTRTEVISLTGGVNESGNGLDLKSGELIHCKNYMEAEGPYTGYMSIKGYERWDGGTLASSIAAELLLDEGLTDETILLLESSTATFTSLAPGLLDAFTAYDTVIASATDIIGSTVYHQTGTTGGIHIADGSNFDLDTTADWTIDFQWKPLTGWDATSNRYLINREGSYSIYVDTNRQIVAEVEDSVLGTITLSSDYTIPNPLLGQKYHIVLSFRASDKKVTLLIDGDEARDFATHDYPLFATLDTIASPAGHMSILASNASTDTGCCTYSYIDNIRIVYDDRTYFSHYHVPTRRYSDPAYAVMNYDEFDREYHRRYSITRVPGYIYGLNGVHLYNGELYALNDDAGQTAASLYKATTSGWTLIDATFNPGGIMRAVNWRIDGYSADKEIMIITDGVSKPRIWDGTTMVIIPDQATATALPENNPSPSYASICTVWANRLVLGYALGEIIMSASFDPEDFDSGFGADIVFGDELKAFIEGPEESLVAFGSESIKIYQSVSQANASFSFQEKTFSRTSGAYADTVRKILNEVIYADDRGIVSLTTTDKFGEFDIAALSRRVNDTFIQKKTTITNSVIEPELNQYRIFFSDNTGIFFTFGEEGLKGATFVEYKTPVNHVTWGRDSAGNLVKYFATDDAFVYKMDSGTSFDGLDIECELQTAYFSYKSPRNWKRFYSTTIEMTCSDPYKVFNFTPDYDYHEEVSRGVGGEGTVSFNKSTDAWGIGKWLSFVWRSKPVINRVRKRFNGRGTNMSLLFSSRSRYTKQHIIHNIVVDYKMEKQRR